MDKDAVFKGVLLLTMFTISVLVGCGGGPYVIPAGIFATSVSSTQNPMVASYAVTTVLDCDGQVMVEFGPDTSYGRTTAWYPTPGYYYKTNILVAGMKASTTYHMRAVAQCSGSESPMKSADSTFTTGVLPSLAFPTLTVTRPSPSSSSPENPGIEMVTIVNKPSPALFTDRDANPIWYYDVGAGNFPYVFKLLPNGHIILISDTLATGATVLREIDLAGNTIRELDIPTLDQRIQRAGFDFIPGAYHHDVLSLSNGHVIILVNFTKNFDNLPGYPGTTAVLGDGLIDLDENWNPVWAWNSFDYLDVTRHLNGLPDWTHSNAVLYSPDGSLLLSMRHQSWVLKIDYNNGMGTGNVLWHLGYQGDYILTNDSVPSDDPSLWFSFQHFPSIISQNGSVTTLAVWDNGDYRPLDTNGDLCSVSPATGIFCHSRAAIFQLDESAMVANLLWSDPLQYFGLWGGSINQLSNGNVEFDLNAPIIAPGPDIASQVQEVTQTSNPQVVWQMNVSPATSNAYRLYRFPSLYPGVAWPY